jgi:hypothetical protein
MRKRRSQVAGKKPFLPFQGTHIRAIQAIQAVVRSGTTIAHMDQEVSIGLGQCDRVLLLERGHLRLAQRRPELVAVVARAEHLTPWISLCHRGKPGMDSVDVPHGRLRLTGSHTTWSTNGTQHPTSSIMDKIVLPIRESPLTWAFAQSQRALLAVGTTGFEPATT